MTLKTNKVNDKDPVILAIVLSGGEGSRLYSLTKDRAKPAVPFLKYRLIDFPLSNCHRSQVDFTFVPYQFEPGSLIEHCEPQFWDMDSSHLKIMGPVQKRGVTGVQHFAGTSAAVRSIKQKIDDVNPDIVLILSGDQIYSEDYREAIKNHIDEDADITVYCKPVPEFQVPSFGVMKIDDDANIIDFAEKPKDSVRIEEFKLTDEAKSEFGVKTDEYRALASMGIYIFSKDAMYRQLDIGGDDFGGDIIPRMVEDEGRVVKAFIFDKFWEDVGQLGSLIAANFEAIHDLDKMIDPFYLRTNPRPYLRPAKGSWEDSIVCEGSVIDGTVKHCVLGYQTIVENNAVMTNCIHFGADRHLTRMSGEVLKEKFATIKEGSKLNNVMLDRNVTIPKDVYLDGSLGPEVIRRALGDIGLYESGNPDKKEDVGNERYGEFNVAQDDETGEWFIVIGKPYGNMIEKYGRETLIHEGFDMRKYL